MRIIFTEKRKRGVFTQIAGILGVTFFMYPFYILNIKFFLSLKEFIFLIFILIVTISLVTTVELVENKDFIKENNKQKDFIRFNIFMFILFFVLFIITYICFGFVRGSFL